MILADWRRRQPLQKPHGTPLRLEELAEYEDSPIISVSPDDRLVAQGHANPPTLWVIEGWLKLERLLRDGQRQIVDVVMADDLIAGHSGGAPAPCDVTAVTHARIVRQAGAGPCSPHSTEPCLRQLAESRRWAQEARRFERVARIGQVSGRARLAYLLLELYVRQECLGICGQYSFELPLSQADLGAMLGLTNVHICRLMKELQEQHVVTALESETLVIRQPDELESLAALTYEQLRTSILHPELNGC